MRDELPAQAPRRPCLGEKGHRFRSDSLVRVRVRGFRFGFGFGFGFGLEGIIHPAAGPVATFQLPK